MFFAGLVALAVSASWPLDTIGDGYLFSVHMIQYLVMTLIAAPLLLAGIPGWLLRELTLPVRPVLARLARPLVALAVFNLVLVVSHWPELVEVYVTNDVAHFGMHVLWVGSGLLFWLPVLSPIPEYPRLSEPLQMGYLFLSSVIPTSPASFLTWADGPFYDVYANSPRLWGHQRHHRHPGRRTGHEAGRRDPPLVDHHRHLLPLGRHPPRRPGPDLPPRCCPGRDRASWCDQRRTTRAAPCQTHPD
ncbi:cytochrome c oxidase assembly protein [Iamia sp.]|uniref:cytochrome c oxidase assembly protein n=1 Tax=Iamia sp. TaxID=2722710 RepID=UPI002D078D62|nr:cytochrome c oxidase assembly protein [Iamia sp.]HXH56206.1 cytochrome c oxidase assembly protein [Iamia sp.]